MKRVSGLLLVLLMVVMAGAGVMAAPTTIYSNDFSSALDIVSESNPDGDWLVSAGEGTFSSVDGQLLCDFDASTTAIGMILYNDPNIDDATITFDFDLTKNATASPVWPAFVIRKDDPAGWGWDGRTALLYFNQWNCLAALGATLVADQGTDYNPAGVGVFSLPIRGTGNDLQEPVTFKIVLEGDYISIYYKAASGPASDLDILRSKWYFPAHVVSAGDPDLGIPASDGSDYFGFMFSSYTVGIDNLSIVQDVAAPTATPTPSPTTEASSPTPTQGANPETGDPGTLIPLAMLVLGAAGALAFRRR